MNPDIQSFVEALSHAELCGVTEVCVNPGGAYNQLVGYFESPSLMAKAIADYDGKMNVYVTLNPVKRDLLARVNNKLAKCKNRTADTDILRDSWFFFDIDPKRPSGISSTDSELQEAIAVGKQIVGYLLSIGVSRESILTGISGNGTYVMVRLPDYEITPERTELKKLLLNFFADQFSTATVEIDRKVYNPARLVAALGTLKMKGESIAERPHRRSEIRTIAGERFDPSLIQRCEPFNNTRSQMFYYHLRRRGDPISKPAAMDIHSMLSSGWLSMVLMLLTPRIGLEQDSADGCMCCVIVHSIPTTRSQLSSFRQTMAL